MEILLAALRMPVAPMAVQCYHVSVGNHCAIDIRYVKGSGSTSEAHVYLGYEWRCLDCRGWDSSGWLDESILHIPGNTPSLLSNSYTSL